MTIRANMVELGVITDSGKALRDVERSKPICILVAVSEGRAPELYDRLRTMFPKAAGHQLTSLTNFVSNIGAMFMSINASALTYRPCPICDSTNRRTVLSLPDTPLGDRFCHDSSEAKALKIYPLRVDRCQSCGHSFIPTRQIPRIAINITCLILEKAPG